MDQENIPLFEFFQREQIQYFKVDISLLMSKALGDVHPSLPEIETNNFQVFYEIFLINALSLNSLIVREKAGIVFDWITKGREYATSEDILMISSRIGYSVVLDNPVAFEATLRSMQIEKRPELNLTCSEFCNLLNSWNINPPEDLLYDFF